MVNASKRIGIIVFVLLLAGGIAWTLRILQPEPSLTGFARSNGRLEAKEVDIAAKYAGRIAEVRAEEGDVVEAGQLLARMDTGEEEAQLRVAEAEWRRAIEALRQSREMLTVAQTEASFMRREWGRSQGLIGRSHVSQERVDRDKTNWEKAQAQVEAARAQIEQAEAAVEATRAQRDRIETIIREASLTSPRSGRVLYRLAEPGEVLDRGGKILTVVDLTDVYITVFLPELEAGRVAIGAPARIVLDAWPDVPFPARVSFLSPSAQFTPKQVETAGERQKLSFRLKARVDVDFLQRHADQVKPGVPGVVYVRLDPSMDWPERLR